MGNRELGSKTIFGSPHLENSNHIMKELGPQRNPIKLDYSTAYLAS